MLLSLVIYNLKWCIILQFHKTFQGLKITNWSGISLLFSKSIHRFFQVYIGSFSAIISHFLDIAKTRNLGTLNFRNCRKLLLTNKFAASFFVILALHFQMGKAKPSDKAHENGNMLWWASVEHWGSECSPVTRR